MRRLQYRNFGSHEMLLTNESVNAGNRTGIRWWELRRSGGLWSIFQQGTYSPDNQNRWMASAAMNGDGTIGLGYSLAGSSNFPSIAYTARAASDPAGSFPSSEVVAVAGGGPQTASQRWGDYSAMNVDPSDDETFWYTTQHTLVGGQWATQVVSFIFSFEIFANGFESGSTAAWSATVP